MDKQKVLVGIVYDPNTSDVYVAMWISPIIVYMVTIGFIGFVIWKKPS